MARVRLLIHTRCAEPVRHTGAQASWRPTGAREDIVAIERLLQKLAFEPDDIARITAAYEEALIELKITNREGAIAELLALYIVEAAQSGLREPADLCRAA